MAYYTVYWPQDWLDELRKSNDTGPVKVVFGSIHSKECWIVVMLGNDPPACSLWYML
jgi:hypothetical protein